MLDRVNVSISLAIIFSILAHAAFLYGPTDSHYVHVPIDSDNEIYIIFIVLFLIFFKGKMMHDDSQFYEDLDNGHFQYPKWTKLGVFIGYWSWFMWAPIIFLLEQPDKVAYYLTGSLVLSSVWLIIDICTRRIPHIYSKQGIVKDIDELREHKNDKTELYKDEANKEKWSYSAIELEIKEFMKRPFWLFVNGVYIFILLCFLKDNSVSGIEMFGIDLSYSSLGAIVLCILLILDWWFSDTASKKIGTLLPESMGSK